MHLLVWLWTATESDLTIYCDWKRSVKIVDIEFCVFIDFCEHHSWLDEVGAQVHCDTWYWPNSSLHFEKSGVMSVKRLVVGDVRRFEATRGYFLNFQRAKIPGSLNIFQCVFECLECQPSPFSCKRWRFSYVTVWYFIRTYILFMNSHLPALCITLTCFHSYWRKCKFLGFNLTGK